MEEVLGHRRQQVEGHADPAGALAHQGNLIRVAPEGVDVGFDPLSLLPKEKQAKFDMQTKEIKHGRIAMMAVLGFVVQELFYGKPVVAETPFFFHPLF